MSCRLVLAIFVRVLALAGASLASLGGTGCASAPVYRPVGPPMAQRTFEGGVGVHGIVGPSVGGVGAAAWMTGQIAKDVFLVARGHATDLLPYDGSGGLFQDTQWGGSGGLRGTYALKDELLIGAEASLDYLRLTSSAEGGTVQHFVSGIAGFPVAEKAAEGLWVYVQPTLGAGYRFGDVREPFAGFTEMPLGLSWQPTEWMVVVVEGGLAIPFSAGYLGAGASFRL